MMQYITSRLNETSTWRGLFGILAAVGVHLRPDLADAIVAFGMAAIGLVNVIRKEKNGNSVQPPANP
jgi:hypothetical protein